MNTTMNKAVPSYDLFSCFLSFYPHKNNRKSVKGSSKCLIPPWYTSSVFRKTQSSLLLTHWFPATFRPHLCPTCAPSMPYLCPTFSLSLRSHIDPCLHHRCGVHCLLVTQQPQTVLWAIKSELIIPDRLFCRLVMKTIAVLENDAAHSATQCQCWSNKHLALDCFHCIVLLQILFFCY